jgi:hypothetical protein
MISAVATRRAGRVLFERLDYPGPRKIRFEQKNCVEVESDARAITGIVTSSDGTVEKRLTPSGDGPIEGRTRERRSFGESETEVTLQDGEELRGRGEHTGVDPAHVGAG